MRASALEETRRRLGSLRPRRVDTARLRPRMPSWCRRPEPLAEAYERHDELYRQGDLVWGALVQANSLLFEAGPDPHPATVLYGLDPILEDEAYLLRDVADALFALKEKPPRDPALRPIATMLAGETDRALGMQVPASLGRGHDLRTTTVVFHREHLPLGRVSGRVFPLLVLGTSGVATVVPSENWGPRVLFEWGVGQPLLHPEVV